jgi:hypothetical protein
VKTSTQDITTLLGTVVAHARLGEYGAAASALNRCIAAFPELLSSQEFKSLPQSYGSRLNYSLETVMLMLKNNDWVAVADIVEYELKKIVEEIGQQIGKV